MVGRQFVAGACVVDLLTRLCGYVKVINKSKAGDVSPWWKSRVTQLSSPRSDYISFKSVFSSLVVFLRHDIDWAIVSWLKRPRKVERQIFWCATVVSLRKVVAAKCLATNCRDTAFPVHALFTCFTRCNLCTHHYGAHQTHVTCIHTTLALTLKLALSSCMVINHHSQPNKNGFNYNGVKHWRLFHWQTKTEHACRRSRSVE